MTLLTGPAIESAVEDGEITIDPFDPQYVGPNSYDLHLSPTLLVYKKAVSGCLTLDPDHPERGRVQAHWPRRDRDVGIDSPDPENFLDMKSENPTWTLPIPEDGLILLPGVLYLGATVEKAGSRKYAPMLEGRSSVARLGLEVHISAGFGDVGFESSWTLELSVVHPLKIYPNVSIAQVSFHTVCGGKQMYDGKYTDQNEGPVASKMHEDRPPRG